MLDDLQKIHERDAQDALGVVEKEWQQLFYDFETTPALRATDIKNIVYAGMGGSAMAALIVGTWQTMAIPFEVVRDYNIPAYVGPETLFVACSYSGNTEETIEATQQAETQGARIAVIASGGRLTEMAHDKHYPLVVLPKIRQPRFAAFYILKALVTLLTQANLTIHGAAELTTSAEFLRHEVAAWLPTVATSKNLAKQIAQECIGKSVVIYSGPKLFPAAYKWKIGFNESAKQIAWCNQFPEFNHNEFIGWSKQPEQKPYTVIDLRSSFEHSRVQKRFAVTAQLLSGLRPAPILVETKGTTALEHLLWAMLLGDFVGVYTGLLNGINPTQLELVDKFKRKMEQ